ncbi:nuclear transport factor 2 family protein [Parasphingorhabdus sp.]|uniref:nuclear transport factor 2 family protein n=1 Tax=Parasphingorhabdus sp. TaxID=2709688 RepID=UPI002F92E531
MSEPRTLPRESSEHPATGAAILRPFRRYVTGFVNCHDFSILPRIMHSDYRLFTSGMTVAGRDDAYKSAVARQLEQFPGLLFTLHEILVTGAHICVRFTEHGASRLHDNARAAWTSIAIYEVSGGLMSSCTIEQDYFSRRRQLIDGQPMAVDPPAIAPWDEAEQMPDRDAEKIVRDWLNSGDWLDCKDVMLDDESATGKRERIIDGGSVEIDLIVSGGGRVAFHAVHSGNLAPDFGEVSGAAEQPVSIHMSGLVTVDKGRVVAGHIIRDRWGLYRRLSKGNRR